MIWRAWLLPFWSECPRHRLPLPRSSGHHFRLQLPLIAQQYGVSFWCNRNRIPWASFSVLSQRRLVDVPCHYLGIRLASLAEFFCFCLRISLLCCLCSLRLFLLFVCLRYHSELPQVKWLVHSLPSSRLVHCNCAQPPRWHQALVCFLSLIDLLRIGYFTRPGFASMSIADKRRWAGNAAWSTQQGKTRISLGKRMLVW